MCRCIAPAVGCRIRDVIQPTSRLQSIAISPRLDQFRRRAVGRKIVAVRRAGKRVVLALEGEHEAHLAILRPFLLFLKAEAGPEAGRCREDSCYDHP